MLTVGSLFSGIGGLELGLERAGMEVKWQCEYATYPYRVLKKHWPNVPKYRDIRKLKNPPYVDVLCGGFPCQDVSTSGKQQGIKHGTRSGLWYEFARVISEVRPRYVVIENVKGLLGNGMGTVLGSLSELRYNAEWITLPASAFGYPHTRNRVFIVAYGCSIGPIHVFKKAVQGKRHPVWSNVRQLEDLRGRSDYPEPLFRRTDDGFPNWMDRLKCLGNAVVPDCAEYVGKCIVESL